MPTLRSRQTTMQRKVRVQVHVRVRLLQWVQSACGGARGVGRVPWERRLHQVPPDRSDGGPPPRLPPLPQSRGWTRRHR